MTNQQLEAAGYRIVWDGRVYHEAPPEAPLESVVHEDWSDPRSGPWPSKAPDGTATDRILALLATGPKTATEVREVSGVRPGSVCSILSRLVKVGTLTKGAGHGQPYRLVTR